MRIFIIFLISILLFTLLLNFDYKGTDVGRSNQSQILTKSFLAYADTNSSGNYFCNTNNLDLEKQGYLAQVDKINKNLQFYTAEFPSASPEEESKYLLADDQDLNLAGKMAECLATNNIQPDSIAQFGEMTQQIMSYDLPKLSQIAPELVKYSTVPEFGTAAALIFAGSLGLMLFFRRALIT